MTYSITLGLLTKFFFNQVDNKSNFVLEFILWGARKSTPNALTACATSVSQCST